MLNIDKTPDLPSVPDTELLAPKKKAPAAAKGGEIDVRKFLALNLCSGIAFVVFLNNK